MSPDELKSTSVNILGGVEFYQECTVRPKTFYLAKPGWRPVVTGLTIYDDTLTLSLQWLGRTNSISNPTVSVPNSAAYMAKNPSPHHLSPPTQGSPAPTPSEYSRTTTTMTSTSPGDTLSPLPLLLNNDPMRRQDPLPLLDSPYPLSIIDNALNGKEGQSEDQNEELEETEEERERLLEQERREFIRVQEDLHPTWATFQHTENDGPGWYNNLKGLKYRQTYME